jgi:hypothetical protein
VSKPFLAILAAVAAIALIVAGCGGGDDSTTEGDASLTKAEFVKQADGICKEANSELTVEFQKFSKENNLPEGKEPTKEQGEELVEEVLIPNVQQQSEDIRELGAPSGDEDRVAAILDALDQGIEEAEEDPAALLDAQDDTFDKANELAADYGLKVCGR